MKRQHFIVESGPIAIAADEHLALTEEALGSREDFARKYRAEGFRLFQRLEFAPDFTPVILSVTGLQFRGNPPVGFVRSDFHPDFAIPDMTTEKGREIATDMVQLPSIPVPYALAAALGFGAAVKIRPDGGATTIGIESLDYVVVLSVPVFSANEIAESPTLAWTVPDEGLLAISDGEYKDMRAIDREHKKNSQRALASRP